MSVTSRTATKRVGEASIGWHNIGSLAAQVSCDSAALAAAAAIAAAANAKVSVIQLLPMPVDASAWALSMDPAISERHEQIRGEAQRQAQDIRHRLASYGVEGDITTLEATFQDPASLAALAARRADLVVTARPSGSIADATYTHALFAGLLLNSGRPVLVVPEGAKITLPIQQAVIAWTDSPEATRAMHDALPLLLNATTVDFVTIDPPASPLESAAEAGEAAALLLRSHGVNVTVHRIRGEGRVPSRLLLDYCRNVKAGLLVAGGYGHPRWREWTVGGTTRELFFETTLPTFFSH
ncbi:universal stress protein [Luteibacter sp. SG786]|uniref:universal stress protein n=1 Tax=Luteibacter sp. SG786 TaxID=2587130 RepID=UPI001423FB1A|nr:universal stress protein [Luteibacter sp. SG786]NII55024.1 nucleotide-binding universal stress UspA family protein [Luteibacter sp. SG786]